MTGQFPFRKHSNYTMQRPSSIAHLNNSAVALMQQGRYQEAIVGFRRATGEMKSSLRVDTDDATAVPEQPNLNFFPFSLRHYVAKSKLSIQAQRSDEGSIFEVFDYAFYLPSRCEVGQTNQGWSSVAMLYNMALSYHLQSLSKGSSDKEMGLAQNLYKMALSVVESCLTDVHSDEGLLMLLLAIFNNLGHIHACSFEAPATTHCVTAMRALLESNTGITAMASEENGELFDPFKLSTVVYASSVLFAFAPVA